MAAQGIYSAKWKKDFLPRARSRLDGRARSRCADDVPHTWLSPDPSRAEQARDGSLLCPGRFTLPGTVHSHDGPGRFLVKMAREGS